MSTGTVYQDPPQSRNEAIIVATIDGVPYTAPPQSRIEDLLLQLKEAIEQGGGGTGTHVEANPEDEATAELAKLKVASTTYSIPPEQVNADWEASSGKAEILHKPTLGTAAGKDYTNEVDAGSIDLLTAGGAYEAIETVYEGAVQKSNVATVEQTLTASKAYVVGEQLYYKQTLTLYTVTAPIAQGGTIVLTGEGANVEVSDKLTDQIKDAKDDISILDSEKLDKYSTTPSDWDATPTANSTKPVTSGGEYNTAVGGYQLVKDTVGWSGKNKNATEYKEFTAYDVAWTVNDDGSIKANGTANNGNSQNGIQSNNPLYDCKPFICEESGQYIINGCSSSTDKVSMYIWCDDDNARPYADSSKTTRISGDIYNNAEVSFYMERGKAYRVIVRVKSGGQANNFVFYPMIRRADILDPTYEPYHAPVSQVKADTSVIAPVEDGTNASQAYALGTHFIRGGKFCTVTTAMAQGDAIENKYTSGEMNDFIPKVATFTGTSSAATGNIKLSSTPYHVLSIKNTNGKVIIPYTVDSGTYIGTWAHVCNASDLSAALSESVNIEYLYI